MPDGRYAIYEHHNWRHQQLVAQGERLTRMEHDHAAWLRIRELADQMRDAFSDLECRHPGDLAECEAGLEEIESNVRGIVGDVVRWAGAR